MAPVNFNLWSTFDILAGLFLLYTESAVPTGFAKAHAGFLIFKGSITQFPIPPIPPLFWLGGAADIISAAIIFTGKPPLLAGYKEIISVLLLQKGLFVLISALS